MLWAVTHAIIATWTFYLMHLVCNLENLRLFYVARTLQKSCSSCWIWHALGGILKSPNNIAFLSLINLFQEKRRGWGKNAEDQFLLILFSSCCLFELQLYQKSFLCLCYKWIAGKLHCLETSSFQETWLHEIVNADIHHTGNFLAFQVGVTLFATARLKRFP